MKTQFTAEIRGASTYFDLEAGELQTTVKQSYLDDGTAGGALDGEIIGIGADLYEVGTHDYESSGDDETTCIAKLTKIECTDLPVYRVTVYPKIAESEYDGGHKLWEIFEVIGFDPVKLGERLETI